MRSFLEPGHVLKDRYEIRGELGRGGFSVVYDALDREVGSPVAVKLLVPPPASAEKARERMRREVLAVRTLAHPHIVRVYDFLEEGPWSFVVMEKVAGGDLHAAVLRSGPLSPDDARALGLGLADALAAAHAHGILHRDVKPQNILLAKDGRALLSDFGSAKIDGENTLTVTGHHVGTLETMAPEVVRGARADGRADIYSLGLTLYFALTGSFPGAEFDHGPPRPAPDGHRPRELRAEVPSDLDAAVARATCADAGHRFPTAGRLADALSGDAADLPISEGFLALEQCLLCGTPDPLGLGVCATCRGEGAGADTCVLVDPAAPYTVREELSTRLREQGGDRVAAEDAARGERPLAMVDAEAGKQLVAQLGARGVPARAVSRRRLWRALPTSLNALLAANLCAGAALGLLVEPRLAWSTALVVPALGWVATRQLARPFFARTSRARLPEALERQLRAVLLELPPGAARSLLGDVVRTARAIFARAESPSDPLAARATELAASAGEAAGQLAALDSALGRLHRHRGRSAELPARFGEQVARCEQARDALVQRLLEALASLGAAAGGAEAALERLAENTAELDAERGIQAEAARELADWLEGGASPVRTVESSAR